MPKSLFEVDECVASHVENLWASGEGYNAAADVLSAIGWYIPPAAAYLRYSRKLLKKWKIEEPPAQAAPLSPKIVLGLAGLAVAVGLIDVGALLLSGFDAILRSQDLFSLRVRDVQILENGAFLRLSSTKTSARHGGKEIVSIRSAAARRALAAAIHRRPPSDLVLARPKHHLRSIFTALLAFFSLDANRLQLYSLRRGGASWDFMQHGSIDTTLERGRWQQARTAKIYVQTAVAEAHDLAIPPKTRRELQYFTRYIATL